MARLNCFIDETGQDDMSSDVYLITLVFHDHSASLDGPIADYVARLGVRSLPDIPFHMVDLIHGHGGYEGLGPELRKPMLYAFATFVRTLPVSYVTLRFDAAEIGDRAVWRRGFVGRSRISSSPSLKSSRPMTRLRFTMTGEALLLARPSGRLSTSSLPEMSQAIGSRSTPSEG